MKKIKSSEYYFKLGAEAMQSRVAAYLVMKGYMNVAPEILGLSLPKFQEVEQVKIQRTFIAAEEI